MINTPVSNQKKVLVVTDAWTPQINGVVKTMQSLINVLQQQHVAIKCITPELFKTIACPLYPEIHLSFSRQRTIGKHIESFKPDYIHIVTEGPLGFITRQWCVRHHIPFTTAFHTLLPDYMKHLAHIPVRFTWPIFRWFHKPATRTIVHSTSMVKKLSALGFKDLKVLPPAIDSHLFKPKEKTNSDDPYPVMLFVGRVSKEKNIEAFLNMPKAGTKYVVGDGPHRLTLMKKYPEAHFTGYLHGEDLAQAFSNADVFVFPSLTDTFGNVVLEALACGTPVAAYPEPGPIDLITDKAYGAYHSDLAQAVDLALQQGEREACAAYAKTFQWEACAQAFLSYLEPIPKSVWRNN